MRVGTDASQGRHARRAARCAVPSALPRLALGVASVCACPMPHFRRRRSASSCSSDASGEGGGGGVGSDPRAQMRVRKEGEEQERREGEEEAETTRGTQNRNGRLSSARRQTQRRRRSVAANRTAAHRCSSHPSAPFKFRRLHAEADSRTMHPPCVLPLTCESRVSLRSVVWRGAMGARRDDAAEAGRSSGESRGGHNQRKQREREEDRWMVTLACSVLLSCSCLLSCAAASLRAAAAVAVRAAAAARRTERDSTRRDCKHGRERRTVAQHDARHEGSAHPQG